MSQLETTTFSAPDPDDLVRYRMESPHLNDDPSSPIAQLYISLRTVHAAANRRVYSDNIDDPDTRRNAEIAALAARERLEVFRKMAGSVYDELDSNGRQLSSVDTRSLQEQAETDAERRYHDFDEIVKLGCLDMARKMGGLLADPETYRPDFLRSDPTEASGQ